MYAILCLSLAVGLSSGVFSNYFKDVFAVDSVQRGLLEIPRETPGILCVVILTALSGLGNLSLMVMAYGFCTLGLAVLGLLSPSYFIMQIFLFSFSHNHSCYYKQQKCHNQKQTVLCHFQTI